MTVHLREGLLDVFRRLVYSTTGSHPLPEDALPTTVKIAVFTDTYLPNIGGVVRSLVNSTDLLSRRGHRIVIFAPSAGRYRDEMKPNIRVVRFTSVPVSSYRCFRIALPNFLRVLRILKEEQPDLVHILHPGPLGATGIACARTLALPVIGTFHALFTEALTYLSLYRLLGFDRLSSHVQEMIMRRVEQLPESEGAMLLKTFLHGLQSVDRWQRSQSRGTLQKTVLGNAITWLYNRCDLVTAPSEAILRELSQAGITVRTRYLSNGIDLSRFTPKEDYGTFGHRLLHVGRIGFEKNVDVLVKAMPLILESVPQASLTVVGDGPAMASVSLLVKELDLQDKVILRGYVPHPRLPDIYRQHDVFVTASTMETQGLVILEGMSCGLPIVGVDSHAIPDLVKSGVNGFIAKPNDPRGIASCIVRMLQQPELMEQLGKKSAMLATNHDLLKVVDDLEHLYWMMHYGEAA